MKSPTKFGLIILTLFALPWVAISIGALIQLAHYARAGNWHDAVVEIISVILCGCIGFGILAAVLLKWKVAAQSAKGRAEHPNEPWLWRPDWAVGRVADSTQSNMALLWMFAACWNVACLPVSVLVLNDAISKGNYRALLALIFQCFGIVLILWARRSTARWRKFGKSVFVMSNVPGVVGGTLAGAIEFQKPFQTNVEFDLQLSCIQRKTRKGGLSVQGNNRRNSMQETELWEAEQTVQLDARGAIPIEFLIPAKARAADIEKGGSQIIWRLTVDAPVAGVSYTASFDVPVFKV
jgi:hypothetical protein